MEKFLEAKEMPKKENNFEQNQDKYTIKLSGVEETFIFDSPEKFLVFIKLTKEILSIYKSNNEDDKFYIEKLNINWKIYEDLVLDNWLIDTFNTTYLTDKTLNNMFINKDDIQKYDDFLNKILNINLKDLDNIQEELISTYANEVKSLYSRYKLIFKKVFEKHSFKDFYDDYKYYALYSETKKPYIDLAKSYFNSISKEKLSKADVSSLVLLNYLLDYGYEIKSIQDLRAISDSYSNNIEFNYLKNLFPYNVKVKYFDENYNKWVRKLKFILEWNNVKIIWITNNKEKVNIGLIQMPSYYEKILKKSREN
jgi:hypothetical protein